MNRFKKPLALLLTAAFLVSLVSACGKSAATAPSVAGTAATTVSPSPSPTVNPQADFIAGAKDFLSTDLVELVTGQENGTRLIGMLSDVLHDLNTKTTQTTAKIALSNLNLDGAKAEEGINITLDALHEAKTGASSVTAGMGLGNDAAISVGAYLTGGTAVLKPGSTDEKIMLYNMPTGLSADNTFADNAMTLLTGLFSEDGKAYSLGSNRADRQALTARYLDPWMTSTSQTDYTDKQVSLQLTGKTVPLRAVTLSMSGQKAYDFVLKNMTAIQADAQFAQSDRLLGALMGIPTTDLHDFILDLQGKGKIAEISSAATELVNQLKALTPEEITGSKFVVSLLFDGKKVIGINIEASTTGKAFLLDGIIYRKGLEHQLDLHYQSIKGDTAVLSLSTVNTGSNTYDVSGTLQTKSAAGTATLSGGYAGKLTETADKYDLTGTLDLGIGYLQDGAAKTGKISGALALSMTHDATGYKATGTGSLGLNAGFSLSADAVLDIGLSYPETVTITPPKYTSANVVTVANKADVWAIHQSDLGDRGNYSALSQDLRLVLVFLLGSLFS